MVAILYLYCYCTASERVYWVTSETPWSAYRLWRKKVRWFPVLHVLYLHCYYVLWRQFSI